MTLYKFTNGTVANATEVNANVNKSLSLPILNKIRQNQDRSVDTSSNKEDIFSDAYTDSNGRQNTVNTGNTTALFNSSLTTYSNDNATASGTTEELGAYSATATAKTTNMEYTCSANADLYVKDLQMVCDGSGTGTMTVKLERVTGSGEYTTIYTKSGTYSGGTSNFASTLADYGGVYIPSGKNFKVLCTLNGNDLNQENSSQPTVSGTLFDIDEGKASGSTSNRVIFGSSGGISCESITTTSGTTKVIEHTIPAGTFSSTVSTLLGKALIYDTETGASITHRLENATENSGDIADGELGTFTAFTSEPTKYIVKLTAKSSGAAPGYPIVKGSGVISE
jgi:hypothetical protein